MDLHEAIKAVEAYAKQYVQYILSFFGGLRDDATTDGSEFIVPSPKLSDGSLLIFGLFSAIIGTTLEGLFMDELKFKDIAFPESVTVLICYWLFLATFMHFLINLGKADGNFSDVLSAILKVIPVTYVLGTYIAFVVYCAVLGLKPSAVASFWAALAFIGAQFVFLVLHLPKAAREIAGPGPILRIVSTWSVIFLAALIQVVLLFAGFEAKNRAPPTLQHAPAGKASFTTLVFAGTLALLLATFTASTAASAQTLDPDKVEVAASEGELIPRAGCGFAKWSQIRQLERWACKKPTAPAEPQASPVDRPSAAPIQRSMNAQLRGLRVSLAASAFDATLATDDLERIDMAAAHAISQSAPRIYVEVDETAGGRDMQDLMRVAAMIRDRLVSKGVNPATVLFQIHQEAQMPAGQPYVVYIPY